MKISKYNKYVLSVIIYIIAISLFSSDLIWSGDFVFRIIYKYEEGDITEKGSLSLSAYNGKSSEVVIPAYLDNLPVTEISDSAFYNMIDKDDASGRLKYRSPDFITSIIIPDTVQYLSANLLILCSNLKNLKIGAEVRNFNFSVLNNLQKLASVNISPENSAYTSQNGIVYSGDMKELIFCPRGKKGTVTIPDKVEHIKEKAFAKCGKITEVKIPDSVKTIGPEAFSESVIIEIKVPDSVKEFSLPEGITEVPWGIFSDCCSLEKVYIPEGVTRIRTDAFRNCKNLKKIKLPESLKEIEECAFANCNQLEELIIPENTEKIESGAFDSCGNLRFIKFGSKIKYFDTDWFFFNYKLEKVEIAEENPEYKSIDNVVFNKEGDKIIFFSPGKKGKYSIPETVTQIECYSFKDAAELTELHIPETVTSIEFNAFKNCRNLRKINLPSSLKIIESETFAECEKLEHIEIPETVTEIETEAFKNCKSLKELILPDGITEIEASLFENCRSLKRIKLPLNLKKICNGAFFKCRSLTSISLPSSLEIIEQNAFDECCSLKKISIPEKITGLEDFTFSQCISLEQIELPDRLEYIGDFVFEGCKSLKQIAFPESVKETGCNIFEYCSDLKKVKLPSALTRIKKSTFYKCGNLTDIKIPENVSEINESAFEGCSSLKNIKLPEKIKEIEHSTFKECRNLRSISIPENVSIIDNRAFSGCESLQTVNIPGTVKIINPGTFENCSSLKRIILPPSISYIGESTFKGCSSLSEIEIPENVREIDEYAFKDCLNLTSVFIPANVRKMGFGVFSDCRSLERVVFDGNAPFEMTLENIFYKTPSDLVIYCRPKADGFKYGTKLKVCPVELFSVTGKVTGYRKEKVKLRLLSENFTFLTESDKNGNFRFYKIPEGNYRISILPDGFMVKQNALNIKLKFHNINGIVLETFPLKKTDHYAKVLKNIENLTDAALSENTLFITGNFRSNTFFNIKTESPDSFILGFKKRDFSVKFHQAPFIKSGSSLNYTNIDADNSDNAYVTGRLTGTLNFENENFKFSTRGSQSIFMKFNNEGKPVYCKTLNISKQHNPDSYFIPTALKISKVSDICRIAGNSYCVKTTNSTPDNNSVEDTSVSLLEYNSKNGNLLDNQTLITYKQKEDINYVLTSAITSDEKDDFYLSGICSGKINFINWHSVKTPENKTDYFLIKYTGKTKKIKWFNNIQTGGSLSLFKKYKLPDIKLCSNNKIYMTGYFSGELRLSDTLTFTAENNCPDIFIAEFDTETGALEWGKQIKINSEYPSRTLTGPDKLHLGVDEYNNIYLSLVFRGKIEFSPSYAYTADTQEGVTAVYDSSGDFITAKHLKSCDSSAQISILGVDTDRNTAETFVTGTFTKTLKISENYEFAEKGTSSFIIKYEKLHADGQKNYSPLNALHLTE